MAPPLLEGRYLSFSYAPKKQAAPLLANFNWRVEAGQFWLLQGYSGSGKTTLLNLVGGLLRPQGGEILFEGRPLPASEGQLARWRQEKVGFIFQDPQLDHQRSVLQNVLLPLYFGAKPLAQGQARALELLEFLGLTPWKQTLAGRLSGGQKQRVAAARALLNNPVLLLADEPLAHLDPPQAQKMIQLLERLQSYSQAAIVMTAHYLPPKLEHPDWQILEVGS